MYLLGLLLVHNRSGLDPRACNATINLKAHVLGLQGDLNPCDTQIAFVHVVC